MKNSTIDRGDSKSKAKLCLAECKTGHPGTSAEVLNCFYTACTGWSFILPANRQSFNLKKLSPFLTSPSLPFTCSNSTSLLFTKFLNYFPLELKSSIFLSSSLLPWLSNLLSHIPLSWIFYLRKFTSIRQQSPVWWVKNNLVSFCGDFWFSLF